MNDKNYQMLLLQYYTQDAGLVADKEDTSESADSNDPSLAGMVKW